MTFWFEVIGGATVGLLIGAFISDLLHGDLHR